MHTMNTLPDRLGTSLPLLLGSLTLAWTLGSCQSPCSKGEEADDSPAHAENAKEKDEKKDEEKDDHHALQRAELALERARLESDSKLSEARDGVRDAEHALEDARIELATFLGHEYPMELAERMLDLEKSQNELQSARADLAGILQIYAEEREARSKDEIIRRNRDAVRFAEEELGIETRRAHLAMDESLPRRERELRRALEKASQELDSARRSLERTERETSLDLQEAELDLQEQRAKATEDEHEDEATEQSEKAGPICESGEAQSCCSEEKVEGILE
jgi:hypothetical protein